jgi:hypothetical protein
MVHTRTYKRDCPRSILNPTNAVGGTPNFSWVARAEPTWCGFQLTPNFSWVLRAERSWCEFKLTPNFSWVLMSNAGCHSSPAEHLTEVRC